MVHFSTLDVFYVLANLHVLVNTSYSEKATIVQTDTDKMVCLTALETLEEMLKTIRSSVAFEKPTVIKIRDAVSSVLEQKVLNNCACVCVCVCVHVCVCVSVCVRVYVSVSVYLYVHVCVCTIRIYVTQFAKTLHNGAY